MGKYILSDNKDEKKLIKNKIFETEKLYNQNTNGGEVELKKSLNKVESDLLISDVEKQITNKNFGSALELIKDPSKTPSNS